MKKCLVPVGDVLDVITCAKFQNEIFRGSDFTGVQFSNFSIAFWTGLTTVQRYSAACDEVFVAIGKGKAAKNDGDVGLSSDYFTHSSNDLAIHISLLFTTLLVHGTSPNNLVTSTVIPIPKGKGLNPTDSVIATETLRWTRFMAIHLISLFCDHLVINCQLRPCNLGLKQNAWLATMVLK